MFEHRMQRRLHHACGRGPRGGRWGGHEGFGQSRRFGPGGFHVRDPEVRSLMGDVRDLGRYLFRQGAPGAFSDTVKVRQLRGIIGRTRTEIETLFGSETATTV